jgi:probable addiction module antidote protein
LTLPDHPKKRRAEAVSQETLEILKKAFHSRDLDQISQAIGSVAKSQDNLAELARRAGLARPSVYRAFTGKNAHPNLSTVVRILEALGLELDVRRISSRGISQGRVTR